jgi:membrane protein
MAGAGKIIDLKSRAAAALWTPDSGDRPPHLQRTKATLRLAAAVLRDLREGDLTLRATALVYTTLLSLAPLLALSFSVLKGLGVQNALRPFLLDVLAPLGEQRYDITARIVGFVSNMEVGVLGALGLATLIYSVVSLMGEIEAAFNAIWRIKRPRPFAAKVRDFLSLLLLGPVLMFISVALTEAARHAEFLTRWFGAGIASSAARIAGEVTAWLLFVAVFTALYMIVPYTRVRPGPAFAAGTLAGVMWKVLGWLFGVFVAGSAGYAAVYSAFAALVLFMIWVYVAWMVVLAGASVCYYLQNPSNQRLSRLARRLSSRVRERLALQICAETGAAFYEGRPAPDAAGLATALSLPAGAIEEVAGDLVEAGILARTGEGGARLIPGCPFDTTPAGDMLARLRATGEDAVAADDVAVSPAVGEVLKTLDDALGRASGRTTLKQLATGTAE